MSVPQVEKALLKFISHPKNSAIILKGDWGAGKTYLWNSVIKSNQSSFARKKYCYVSLFGLNGLNELKRSIFENTVPSNKAGNSFSKDSVLENFKNLDFSDASTSLKRIFSFGKEIKIPFINNLSGVVDSIQYASIENSTICIDDFERRGNALSSRDVLGLISNLVESKKCSVILILNDENLKKEDEFYSFSEKVFDYEIKFSPSVKESANLVFGSQDQRRKPLVQNIINLNINNIRLIKKIEIFASILDTLLTDAHPKVIEQTYSTLPLVVFSIYGSDKCKVDIDYILDYKGDLVSYMPDNPSASAEELEQKKITREKTNYLEEYGFGRCDEFDALIVSLVKKGYPDEDLLRKLAHELENKIKHDENIALLRKAWDLFHSSFSDNDQEVYAAFEFAISNAIQHFTIDDIDSIASIYYDSEKKEYINTVIDEYFSTFFINRDIKDKDDIFHWPRNPYIITKLNEYFESLTIEGDLSAFINKVAEAGGLPDGNIRKAIAKKPDSDFYDYFSKLNSKDFTRHARLLLKCGEVRSYDEDITNDFKNIFRKTYESLLKLSKLSPLNKIRMDKFRSYEDIYNHYKKEQDENNKNT
jgi:hypothetical protein